MDQPGRDWGEEKEERGGRRKRRSRGFAHCVGKMVKARRNYMPMSIGRPPLNPP
jgi:hypothetical protein